MLNCKNVLLLLLMTGFFLKAWSQQGIQFSQYSFTGLTVNPAYAGYKEDWTLNLVSRLQWTGIPGSPRTGAVSIDGLTDDQVKKTGLGLVITEDQLGPQTTSSVYGNYSYRLRLDDDDTKRICFGLGFGAAQYNVNQALFNATDTGDPSLTQGNISKITPDIRFGVFYSAANYYVGVSGLNLLSGAGFKDNSEVIREARTYYLTGGYMMSITAGIDWKPSVLIKEDLKGPTNVDLTTAFLFGRAFWVGASYRTGVKTFSKIALQTSLSDYDALSGIAEFYISERFRVGYSYDYNISKLAGAVNGTHELSLSVSFKRKSEKVLSPRYF